MSEEKISLAIADTNAAIRYLGEMQSRPMDPIHEPIQNLLDEKARLIEVEIDAKAHKIRIRGDARPITSLREARRILQSICASRKVGKLGEKGVGMLSFVTVGSSMTTLSQKGGRVVWFTLDRNDLSEGKVGMDKGNRLPRGGTEIRIKGINPRTLKYRFAEDRVIKDVKRRWGPLLSRGVQINVNGRDVSDFTPPLQGEMIERRYRVRELGTRAAVEVRLLLLKEPSDLASVSVTHLGQANFLVSEIPIFDGHNAFTQGMLHGTITGDIAPINASRTGFREAEEFELWLDRVLTLEEELGKIIEERIRVSAEARDSAMLNDWMRHLRSVFRKSELASTVGSSGPGEDEGWSEPPAEKGGKPPSVPPSGMKGSSRGTRGDQGRLPTVPHAGFSKAAPSIRVIRGRKSFRINVNHPDYVLAAKSRGGRRRYIRELCMHEAYIYSLEGEAREWFIHRSDEFLGYWTHAFIGK